MNAMDLSSSSRQHEAMSSSRSPKSDSFMSTSTYFQTSSHENEGRAPNHSDNTLMARYVMVCVELERVKRIIERQTATSPLPDSCTVPSDYELLKLKEQSRNKEIIHFKDELTRHQHQIKQLDQIIKDKDVAIAAKNEQLRTIRQQLQSSNLGLSKTEVNERNRIRQLDNQLLFQRSKLSSITKRKEEIEEQLKEILHKQQVFIRASADYQSKIRNLEDELRDIKLGRSNEDVKNQHVANNMQSQKRQREETLARLQELTFEAERGKQAKQRVQDLELENIRLLKQNQEAINRNKILEIEIRNYSSDSNVKDASKNIVLDGELATLRRNISNLQARLLWTNNNLQLKDRELSVKTKQWETAKQSSENLEAQITELTKKQVQTLNNVQYQKKTDAVCMNCTTSKTEMSALMQKIYTLERQLRESNLRLEQQQTRVQPQTTTIQENKLQQSHYDHHYSDYYQTRNTGLRNQHVGDLILAAQHIKHSNQRVKRLLESSQERTTKSLVRSVSRSRRHR